MDVTVRTKARSPKAETPQIVAPPVTREAVLMCEPCQGFKLHQFVVTRRVNLYTFEQVYGCTCCKAERRYGLLA
jgi:hypothetical protein